MLSINTNLSSLIAQNSLTQSTSKLNQAIERMSTGFKINHASDNAANYSISTNMTTKMSAYMVAEDNTAMGLDLVTTASEIISQMENKAERLRALSIQAGNGTYGAQSMGAIQSEANALMQEITRLYLSSEYNGLTLFSKEEIPLPFKAGKNGFIDETAVDIKPEYDGFIANPKTYEDSVVDAMTSIDSFTNGASGEFKIEDANDLAKLATFVNTNNYDTSNATFVLADDIDLTQWCADNGDWVPIGYGSFFKGNFDGNGHVISGLTIDNSTAFCQGLFGYLYGSKTIKNVGVEGSITAQNDVGGLVGYASASYYIENCYSNVEINASGTDAGGLVGYTDNSQIKNCYATGDVTGTNYVGGLVGSSSSSITNSYATGNTTGQGNYVGGLVGAGFSITNSYATGDVTGANNCGGLTGYANSSIENSYATGDVSGGTRGGLVGDCSSDIYISNSYATGDVGVAGGSAGSFIGNFITGTIIDCYVLESETPLVGSRNNSDFTGIVSIKKQDTSTNLQIGINGNDNSRLNFNTNFQYDLSALEADIGSDSALNTIDEFINLLSAKQTELGAVQNRLESALDEIAIQYDNLASSRSTLRDADMAELSSEYIKMQILQEASATLLATANQSPSIALQLI